MSYASYQALISSSTSWAYQSERITSPNQRDAPMISSIGERSASRGDKYIPYKNALLLGDPLHLIVRPEASAPTQRQRYTWAATAPVKEEEIDVRSYSW